jgi:hypothetical protein
MPKDLTYQINAAVAEALSHGASRAEIEKLVYLMRQRAMAEEQGSKPIDVPLDVPDDEPPKAA